MSFKLKRHHWVIYGVLLLFCLFFASKATGVLLNDFGGAVTDTANRVVLSKYSSMIECGDLTIKSYGLPLTGNACVTDQDCKDNWPAGPSLEARDRSGCYCSECGEVIQNEV